jgi:nitrogen fixation protein NifQ
MNALSQTVSPSREEYCRLFSRHGAQTSPNGEWLCRMLANWRLGKGAMPDFLGLAPNRFQALLAHFFPGVRLNGRAASGRKADYSRMLEREDLLCFVLTHAAPGEEVERAWRAELLVAGCLGEDRLWQDLGLWSRADLSALIAHNFPDLAALNAKDMKWKKFLYKKLCETEGIYVCRAPSCEVCADYPKCFGPEK